MFWYCRFTWYPGTNSDRVRQRVLQQHAAGTNHPEKIRGWYNLAGGGAGFLLIEADDPRELNAILEPYMDLVSWDCHAVYELPYASVTERFREMVRGSSPGASSTEANKALIRRVYDRFNAGDLSFVDEYLAPSYIEHRAGQQDIFGREAARKDFEMWRSGFRDAHITIEEMIAEADRVVCRFTGRGTHTGEFAGVAPTGKLVAIRGMSTSHISNGMIAEEWMQLDTLGLMQQIGAVEPLAEPQESYEAADILSRQL